ncbi:hypothetical protein BZM26_00630 [Paraburkholderia strydomiana]|nr:hypothetical protein BZM26_00630 [Paraburkholderia strydomiana]
MFFPRSGNTALADQNMVRWLNARLFALGVRGYGSAPGGVKAIQDTRGEDNAISDRVIDLSKLDTLSIGSPI